MDRFPPSRTAGAVRLLPPALLLPVFLALACAPAGPAPAPAPEEEERPVEAADPADPVERAGNLLESGEPAAALEALFELPADAPDPVRDTAGALAASAAREVSTEELERLAGRADAAGPALAAVRGELALVLHLEGEEERARELAREAGALDAGAGGRVARAVLEGRIEDVAPTAVLGAVLPVSGSPTMQRYARLVEEGAEIAVREHTSGLRRPVRLEVGDDRGTPAGASAATRELGASEPIGIVGPLVERSLDEAARARSGVFPLVSPTARLVPEGRAGVYSLSGFDPGAALAAAEYAMGSGLRTAVIVRPRDEAATAEARAFREAYEERGGSVVRELSYPPGSTHFGDVLREVGSVRPGLLFLPLPAEDVTLLAPQITFFGLDSLGVQVIGNRSWTEADVLAELDARHLEAVAVVTPRPPGESLPGWETFVAAYEETHRRSLRSEVPAYGYDAAALLIEAARRAGRGGDVGRSFEEIRDFPGATGVLSVRDGHIVRRHVVLVFEGGEARPLPAGEVPALERRDRLREQRERRRGREQREQERDSNSDGSPPS